MNFTPNFDLKRDLKFLTHENSTLKVPLVSTVDQQTTLLENDKA